MRRNVLRLSLFFLLMLAAFPSPMAAGAGDASVDLPNLCHEAVQAQFIDCGGDSPGGGNPCPPIQELDCSDLPCQRIVTCLPDCDQAVPNGCLGILPCAPTACVGYYCNMLTAGGCDLDCDVPACAAPACDLLFSAPSCDVAPCMPAPVAGTHRPSCTDYLCSLVGKEPGCGFAQGCALAPAACLAAANDCTESDWGYHAAEFACEQPCGFGKGLRGWIHTTQQVDQIVVKAVCGPENTRADGCVACDHEDAGTKPYNGSATGTCSGYSLEENWVDAYTAYFDCERLTNPYECDQSCYTSQAEALGFGPDSPPSCDALGEAAAAALGSYRGVHLDFPGGGQPPTVTAIRVDDGDCRPYVPTLKLWSDGWAIRT